ncbi:hypothetical protein QWJ07_31365 [Frankia sp. RB7]|nr:hypothetical protein [Frankia sp. RB7]
MKKRPVIDLKKDERIAAEKFRKILRDNLDEAAIPALMTALSEWCCDLGSLFAGRASAIVYAKEIAAEVEKKIHKNFDLREGKLPH